MTIVPVEEEFVLFLQHCRSSLSSGSGSSLRPGSIAAGTWGLCVLQQQQHTSHVTLVGAALLLQVWDISGLICHHALLFALLNLCP